MQNRWNLPRFARDEGTARDAAASPKGVFSFVKENTPFENPRERLLLAVSGLKGCGASGVEVPAKFCCYTTWVAPIFAVAQPLAALLPYGCGTPLAGAALPAIRNSSAISVYYRSLQTCFCLRGGIVDLQARNASLSLGGYKGGGSLSRKRTAPFTRAEPQALLLPFCIMQRISVP